MKKFLFCLLSFVVVAPALPHGGGLDANGGHYNRKTGEYHYHRKVEPSNAPSVGSTFKSQPNSSKSAKIGEYFRKYNQGVIYYKGGTAERDVSQSMKDAVKRRDGNKCIICGSTYKLEVDHARALMNGGSNAISNLFTLCDPCHTEKTRMDNSLRRNRQK